MGQYLEALLPPLSRYVDITLFAPEHFQGEVPVKVVRFRTGKSRLRALMSLLNPLAARRVWEAVRAESPDLLYVFNGEGYPWTLFFSRWAHKEGLPFVLTLHDPEPHPGNLWELANAFLRRIVIPKTKSVHVHAQVFVESVRRMGAREVVMIPHGSLAERFLRHVKEGVKREKDLVLFFGRLEPYKGVETLVEAIIALKGKKRVLIAGPGRMPTKLQKALREHPGWFEVHNRYILDEEAALFLQRASILVLPYRQATQSSLPLIGAAFGLPVVASAVGAFVKDVPRVGGILVSPNDPKALAEALMEAELRCSPRFPPELTFQALAEQFASWLGKSSL